MDVKRSTIVWRYDTFEWATRVRQRHHYLLTGCVKETRPVVVALDMNSMVEVVSQTPPD
ncbi:hypothetical protein A2U01_0007310 [Trifolium medium]|uniref:Uncharacterized protein n=1 Tax=Trifolium medium TaxID=97028 RepID=A0A392MGY9_9FABA|nr:hypothetical protein [Trifolium medium]